MIWFILCCFFLAACIAVFIAILLLPPVNRTNSLSEVKLQDGRVGKPSGLQQSYTHSDGSIQILDALKPLDVSLKKDGPIKNAFVFTDIESKNQIQEVEVEKSVHAFFFSVRKPVTVIALQIIDSLYDAGERQVGIFHAQSKSSVCTGNVSKENDMLLNGFRTHSLPITKQVQLLPNVLYACVGLVFVNDRVIVSNNTAFPANILRLNAEQNGIDDGFVARMPSNELVFPPQRVGASFCSPFASFQIQEKQVPNTSVFAVDAQYARFPPFYMHGFKVTILPNSTIHVTRGYCASVYGNANLVSENDLQIQVTDLVANTWYAVFIVDDNPAGIYGPHLELSQNFAELGRTENHRYRRIGWARTHPFNNAFFTSEQEGVEVRRDTVYMEPVVQHEFEAQSGFESTFAISNVPPSTNECGLAIEAEFLEMGDGAIAMSSFDIYLGDILYHMYPNQAYQMRNITVPIELHDTVPRISFKTMFSNPDAICKFTLKVLNFKEDL